MAKTDNMTDEERYGKVGAEIRRLDPEAYKNRPRSAEGNLKLLKELRAKASQSSAPRAADSDDYKINRPKMASSEDSAPKQLEAESPPRLRPSAKLGTTPDYNQFEKISQMYGKPKAGYYGMRKGGGVKKYASGGSVSSASKRADGCATKGKTKGRFV